MIKREAGERQKVRRRLFINIMGSSHLILEKNNSGDGLLLAEISFGDILKVM